MNASIDLPEDIAEARVALIDTLFDYHTPTPNQTLAMGCVRSAAKILAAVIETSCPPSADRTDAMRKLGECVMTANRSIVLGGQGYR